MIPCAHFCFVFLILHTIQLTPQKLSAARKNLPGATGASEWPEDRKLHRGREDPAAAGIRRIFSLSKVLFCF